MLPARGATYEQCAPTRASRFQSTLPARGATRLIAEILQVGEISIHAPRTGSDVPVGLYSADEIQFQSTLPARGATAYGNDNTEGGKVFQSTLPARGATQRDKSTLIGRIISIHAPRTGSDHCHRQGGLSQCHFNPRSPHGERLPSRLRAHLNADFNPRSPHGERLIPTGINRFGFQFQSTLPARGATPKA